jgi:hypothetical protein
MGRNLGPYWVMGAESGTIITPWGLNLGASLGRGGSIWEHHKFCNGGSRAAMLLNRPRVVMLLNRPGGWYGPQSLPKMPLYTPLTLIRMIKDEKVLAFFKGLLL